MSDMAPLPDSSNPFEILGVSRDADRRTLRRAYARLIKVYRPETHPKEFQRIQQAFEEAGTASPETVWSETEDIAQETLEDHHEVSDVKSDDSEEEESESWSEEELDVEASLVMLQADISANVDRERLVARIRDNIRRNPHFIGDAFERHYSDILSFILSAREFTAAELAATTAGGAASWVLGERLDYYGLSGELESLMDDFEDIAFLRTLEDDESLRSVALRFACAMVFRHPEFARKIYDFAATSAEVDEWTLEGLFQERLAVREDFRAWARKARAVDLLIQYIECCDTLTRDPLRALCIRLQDHCRTHKMAVLRALTSLSEQSDALWTFVYEQVQQAPLDQQIEEVEEAADHTRAVKGLVMMADDKLGQDKRSLPIHALTFGPAYLGVRLFQKEQYVLAVMALSLSLAGAWFGGRLLRSQLYKKRLCPIILRFLSIHHVPYPQLMTLIDNLARRKGPLRTFLDDLKDDAGLALYALLMRLRPLRDVTDQSTDS